MYEDQELPKQNQNRLQAYAGEILNTILDTSEDLYVTIDGIDGGTHKWGPCKFETHDHGAISSYPAAGFPCLVVFDDNRDPWVVVWWEYE